MVEIIQTKGGLVEYRTEGKGPLVLVPGHVQPPSYAEIIFLRII